MMDKRMALDKNALVPRYTNAIAMYNNQNPGTTSKSTPLLGFIISIKNSR